MEQCSDCRFWRNWDSEMTNLGECHRFPPRMLVAWRADGAEGSATTVRPEDGGWPLTAPDDWCGEFQRPPERLGPSASHSRGTREETGPAGI